MDSLDARLKQVDEALDALAGGQRYRPSRMPPPLDTRDLAGVDRELRALARATASGALAAPSMAPPAAPSPPPPPPSATPSAPPSAPPPFPAEPGTGRRPVSSSLPPSAWGARPAGPPSERAPGPATAPAPSLPPLDASAYPPHRDEAPPPAAARDASADRHPPSGDRRWADTEAEAWDAPPTDVDLVPLGGAPHDSAPPPNALASKSFIELFGEDPEHPEAGSVVASLPRPSALPSVEPPAGVSTAPPPEPVTRSRPGPPEARAEEVAAAFRAAFPDSVRPPPPAAEDAAEDLPDAASLWPPSRPGSRPPPDERSAEPAPRRSTAPPVAFEDVSPTPIRPLPPVDPAVWGRPTPHPPPSADVDDGLDDLIVIEPSEPGRPDPAARGDEPSVEIEAPLFDASTYEDALDDLLQVTDEDVESLPASILGAPLRRPSSLPPGPAPDDLSDVALDVALDEVLSEDSVARSVSLVPEEASPARRAAAPFDLPITAAPDDDAEAPASAPADDDGDDDGGTKKGFFSRLFGRK